MRGRIRFQILLVRGHMHVHPTYSHTVSLVVNVLNLLIVFVGTKMTVQWMLAALYVDLKSSFFLYLGTFLFKLISAHPFTVKCESLDCIHLAKHSMLYVWVNYFSHSTLIVLIHFLMFGCYIAWTKVWNYMDHGLMIPFLKHYHKNIITRLYDHVLIQWLYFFPSYFYKFYMYRTSMCSWHNPITMLFCEYLWYNLTF